MRTQLCVALVCIGGACSNASRSGALDGSHGGLTAGGGKSDSAGEGGSGLGGSTGTGTNQTVDAAAVNTGGTSGGTSGSAAVAGSTSATSSAGGNGGSASTSKAGSGGNAGAGGPDAASFAKDVGSEAAPARDAATDLGRDAAKDQPAVDTSADAIPLPAGYALLWSDEFDVDGAPNPKNWNFEKGLVRNQEAQYYQPDNASVQNGFLIIEARKERVGPLSTYSASSTTWPTNQQYANYTSSSLTTSGLQTFPYGRFEMRARINTDKGMWPAFWTLGVSGEWPSNGEIDIMEYYAGNILANVAWGTSTRWVAKWDSSTKAVSSFGDAQWSSKFHVWRMDWDDQNIVLSVDDLQMNTTSLATALNPDGTCPFKQKSTIIVNLAIGGANGGDPSTTTFPARYEIDYVRVYQKK
jgi:beta-glucanase (GH16 family)